VDISQPEKLFYYCSAENALTLLETGNICWLSPAQFNGATELNQDSGLSFDKESLTDSSIKLGVNLIFGREAPKGETPILGAIRRWRDAQRFSTHEEAQVVLKDLLSKMVDQRFEDLQILLQKWRSFCQKFRIVSMFEKPDNFVAWDKYACNFSGVVIRFKTGEDSCFNGARAVTYQNSRPEITSLKEQYTILFHNQTVNAEESFQEKFLMKAPPHKNEREWRFFKEDGFCNSSDPTDWTSELSYEASDLTTIYLGPYISTEVKERILTALKNIDSDKKVFQMKFAKGKFDLGADQIHISED